MTVTMPGSFRSSPARLLILILLPCLLSVSHLLQAQQTSQVTPLLPSAIDVSSTVIMTRDDISLLARVIRPAGPGPYPALYAASPYPLPRGNTGDFHPSLGPVNWYVNQGFAVVIVNTRGTGGSQGDFGFFSRQEQQDHYEVIDWIAAQDWSNGQVAGYGSGYSATSQWQMASQFSPPLVCIAPHNAVLDPYRELVRPGGLRNRTFIEEWYETGVRDTNAMAEPGRMVDFDLLQATRAHPLFDDFWQVRAPRYQFGQINTPVLVLLDWMQLGAGSNPADYSDLLVDWHLLLAPGLDYTDVRLHESELLPWYRNCLDQLPGTDSADLPQIRLQAINSDQVIQADRWPLPEAEQQSLNLSHSARSNTTLSLQAENTRSGEILSETALSYTSAPLAESLLLAGPAMFELHLTPRNQDTAVTATLYEENIAGQRTVMASGQLRASLRAATGAGDFQPLYRFNSEQAFVPGRPYRLDIAMGPVARSIQPGTRLVLEVALTNDGTVPANGGHQILFGGDTSSRLWLPVVEGSLEAGTAPAPANAFDSALSIPEASAGTRE